MLDQKGEIDMMTLKDIEPVVQPVVQTTMDNVTAANHAVCIGKMGGSEGVIRRLLEAAQFTPVQLRVVEYLMNDAAENVLGALLDQLNTLIASDQLRLSIATG